MREHCRSNDQTPVIGSDSFLISGLSLRSPNDNPLLERKFEMNGGNLKRQETHQTVIQCLDCSCVEVKDLLVRKLQIIKENGGARHFQSGSRESKLQDEAGIDCTICKS